MTEPTGNVTGEAPLPSSSSPAVGSSPRSLFIKLWHQIKQTRIVQWTAAYLVAILPIMHFIEMVSHTYELPLNVSRVAFTVLLGGVPFAAGLAWRYGERASHRVTTPQLLIIMLLCVLTAGMFSLLMRSDPRSNVEFGRLLSSRDPAIFYGSRSGRYEIARVLPTQAALREETILSAEIREAQMSFDLMANTAGTVFRSHEPEFLAAVKRGVNIRILLCDYSPDNRENFDNFAIAVGEAPEAVRLDAKYVAAQIEKARAKLSDGSESRGTLELRWYQKPIFYTAWIRDRKHPDAIAHLSVHMYRSKNEWPSFRFGRDAKDMVGSISDDFDMLWMSAKRSQTP
jgi:hypothetical protein